MEDTENPKKEEEQEEQEKDNGEECFNITYQCTYPLYNSSLLQRNPCLKQFEKIVEKHLSEETEEEMNELCEYLYRNELLSFLNVTDFSDDIIQEKIEQLYDIVLQKIQHSPYHDTFQSILHQATSLLIPNPSQETEITEEYKKWKEELKRECEEKGEKYEEMEQKENDENPVFDLFIGFQTFFSFDCFHLFHLVLVDLLMNNQIEPDHFQAFVSFFEIPPTSSNVAFASDL